ncbi:MAG TPA: TSUP family transporter [Alphaproteobacteria bacterium]|nr:TSUP family transporter [Alphaproteobacteria bacterium]
MLDISGLEAVPILVGVGVCAGIIEASAGGSGLIVVPILLMLGLSPASAMATSKLQYTFGALTSIVRFHQANLVKWKSIAPMMVAAALAGTAGAFALIYTNPKILGAIIPLLLAGAALYFIFSPRISDVTSAARLSRTAFVLGPVVLIGFYDGFFGVGSASFYVLAMVWGLGFSARNATATTKVVDFINSTAALIVLAIHHEVLWLPGALLGLGQIGGAWIGAGLVIRRGAKFVRPVLVIVSLGLSLKLLFDYRDVFLAVLP